MFKRRPNKSTGSKLIEAKIKIGDRRSRVRVYTTYLAAAFLFGGGTVLIIASLFFPVPLTVATFGKDIFYHLTPLASSIIAFWFAKRESQIIQEEKKQDKKS